MKHILILGSILLLGLTACDDGKKADPAKDGDAKKADDGKDDKGEKEEGETKPAADTAEAPDCAKVVDHIASFNEGSGDAEKKLWNKMCAEMNDAQKVCVSKAEDMDGMKACMNDKGDEKLTK